MQSSQSRATDKTKRRIRIVVSENHSLADSSAAPAPSAPPTAPPTQHPHHHQIPRESEVDTKRLNIDYGEEGSADWDKDREVLILSGRRNKNDKNWENWERIREQKLEKMKGICFESYRQSKKDKLMQAKPRPKQLDPTWYTDNIYSNRSDDMDEDYVPDCLKYGPFRPLRDIHELDEKCAGSGAGVNDERRGEGEGSPGYGLHRSKSCKEFQYPKSQSWCFEGNVFEAGGGVASASGTGAVGSGAVPPTTSILKNRAGVPKSYSFSATTKTMPFDIIDYELPPATNTRREKREAYRRNMNFLCSSSFDERTLAHRCCARDQCTSARCLLDDIYPGSRPRTRTGSNRNLSAADWLFEERGNGRQRTPAVPTVVCCCSAADDCCCHRQQRAVPVPAPRTRSRAAPHCPGHHPAAEEEEHMHCRYDTDLEHFIRAERERLMLQDKFLDEDERYLAAAAPRSPGRRYPATNYQRASRSKSLLDMQLPPERLFDEDTCSDTTEIDLEDFNIDLEKYWEQLDKPPSPINMDMRRNMHSSLKVKNVNVRCYNNGQPIDLHDREHERLMIKKSLLEGMPSPPQLESSESSTNAGGYPFFDNAAGATSAAPAFHHPRPPSYGYGHKVYPAMDTLPSYQYNNFYPEHSHPTVGSVLTQQPTAGIHHPSAGGHSALSLINNIFSIYKPNKYSPENCQMNFESKPEPCKKMNVPSTRRPLGAATPHQLPLSHPHDYMHSSMKRPLLVSADQPHFKIIPEKTGLKISPLLSYEDYGGSCGPEKTHHHRLSSTARPLMLPH